MPVTSESPILVASKDGNTDALRSLITSGARINEKSRHGHTPLMCASIHGHLECVRLLLNNRAHVNKVNNYGETALLLANFAGHSACVNLLLEHGADVHLREKGGYTPLLCAALSGKHDCITHLLSRGANVNDIDSYGDTALHKAALYGHINCIETLLQHNADYAILNIGGERALDVADLTIKPQFETLLQEIATERSRRNDICTKCECGKCVESHTEMANAIHNLSNEVVMLKRKADEQTEEMRRMKRQHRSDTMAAAGPMPSDMIHLDYLAPETRQLFANIADNKERIQCYMNPGPVIDRLWSKDILTEEQYQEVRSPAYPTDIAKTKYLLGLVNHGPLYLEALREALAYTDQEPVADLLA